MNTQQTAKAESPTNASKELRDRRSCHSGMAKAQGSGPEIYEYCVVIK
jgi:hypothetical protein